MLYWALVFLIVAIIAAIFGFGGVAVAAAGIAKLLFFIFLVVFIITFPYIRRVYRRIRNPLKLGIISLYPRDPEGTPAAGEKVEILEEPFE